MPQLPSAGGVSPNIGGYLLEPGFYYRAAVSLSGPFVGAFATHSRIVNAVDSAGFDPNSVQVWSSTSDQGFPQDWPDAPQGADVYASGRYEGVPGKVIPVTQSAGPYSGTVLGAWVYDYQPTGAPPPVPITPNSTPSGSSGSGLVAVAIGLASLAGLGWWYRHPIMKFLKTKRK